MIGITFFIFGFLSLAMFWFLTLGLAAMVIKETQASAGTAARGTIVVTGVSAACAVFAFLMAGKYLAIMGWL